MAGRGGGAAPALNVGRGAPAGVAGGSGAAVGRGHPGCNSGAFGLPAAAAHSAAPALPFGAHAELSAAEHAPRYLLEQVPTDLCSVKECWTEQQPGALLAASRSGNKVKLDPSVSVPPVADPAVPEGEKAVNARALIFAGVQTGSSSVLERANVIGKQCAGQGSLVQAYGGLVPAGSDESITQAMAKMVANQSGMDLSSVKQWTKLVEVNYDGDKPKSVFYLPSPTFPAQVAEEQLFPKAVQKEETKEVEVDEECETEVEEGEGDEKRTKKVKKTRKVKKDKVFKEPATTKPAVVSLLDMDETLVTEPVSCSAYEFHIACRALIKWLARDHEARPEAVQRRQRAAYRAQRADRMGRGAVGGQLRQEEEEEEEEEEHFGPVLYGVKRPVNVGTGDTFNMRVVLSSLVHHTDLADALRSTGRLYDLAGRKEGLLPELRRFAGLDAEVLRGLKRTQLVVALQQHVVLAQGRSGGLDALEFTLELLDRLHDEITDTYVGQVQPAAPEAAAPEKELSEVERLNALPPNESPSLVRRLFEGGVRKSMDCPKRCAEGASAVEESFYVLSLMLPRRKRRGTIDLEAEHAELSIPTLLADYFSDKQVKRDCEKCRAVQGTISERLCRLPSILLLHVKRFESRMTRDRQGHTVTVPRRYDPVAVPKDLCLDDFCTEDAELPPETAITFADSGELRGRRPLRKAPPKDTGAHDSERHRYRLRGVVMHCGPGLHHGDYQCAFRSGDGTWWRDGIEPIRRVPGTAEQVLSQQDVLENGYLFCYERCGE